MKHVTPALSRITAALLLLCGPSIPAHAQTSGLIAKYSFEDNLDDSSGHGYSGIGNALTYGAGKVGRAALFDGMGTNVKVDALAGVLPSGNQPRTMAFWMYLESGQATFGNMISWGTSDHSHQRYSIGVQNNGTLYFVGEGNDVPLNRTVPFNTWAHVVITYENQSFTSYIDGVINNAPVTINAFDTNPAFGLILGEGPPNHRTGQEYFKGRLDELAIYDRALTAAEVRSIALNVPTEPLAVSASAGNALATVQWTPPSADGGSAITGYVVTAVEDPSKSCTATPPATSCVVPNLANGTSYTFTVRADNANGTGADSTATAPVTPAAPPVPSAPQSPAATAGNGQATVSWSEPASGGPFTLYTVTSVEDPSKSCTATPPATSCVVPGLTNGTSYTFTVRASNASGMGAASTTSNAVTPQAPAPSAQTITFGPQAPQTYTAGGSFAISPQATASSGLAVAYSSLTPDTCTVASVTVTIISAGTCTIAANQTGNGSWLAAAQVTQSVTIAKAAQTVTFPAQPAKAYAAGGSFSLAATASSGLAVVYTSQTPGVCSVQGSTVTMVSAGTCTIAANQPGDGNWNSAAQQTQNITINAAAPGAPTDVQATPGAPGNGQATVRWTAPADTGAPITYTVRALVNGQPSGQTCTAMSPATECTVNGLTAGVTYTFSVEASNGAGNAAAPSNPVTPQAAVQSTQSIPTLSEWALMALSSLLALAAVRTRRRQG